MIALVMVRLVVAQTDLAPVACFEPRVSQAIETTQRALLRSSEQLDPFVKSKRADVEGDRAVAQWVTDELLRLFEALNTVKEVADLGALSTEAKVKLFARRRLFVLLKVVRARAFNLGIPLARSGDLISLPVLANEVKELRRTTATMEEQLSDCLADTKVPGTQ